MKIVSTSVTVLAAFGMLAGASVAASACSWHKSHVTASAAPAPVEEKVTLPTTAIDPVQVADLDKAAILPRVPDERLDTEAK